MGGYDPKHYRDIKETRLLSSMKSVIKSVISGLVVVLLSASWHPEVPAFENQVESHSASLKGKGLSGTA